jgi:hypothetical protein
MSTVGRRRQGAERLVCDDARQPGRETSLALETVEVGEGADIALLHCLLGIVRVPQDASREAVEPLVVAAHDGRESVGIAAAHALQHLAIAVKRVNLVKRHADLWSLSLRSLGSLPRGKKLAPAALADGPLDKLALIGGPKIDAYLAALWSLWLILVLCLRLRDLLLLLRRRAPGWNQRRCRRQSHPAEQRPAGYRPGIAHDATRSSFRDERFLRLRHEPQHDVVMRVGHAGVAGIKR